ncbi:nitrate reductase NapE component [Methylobacterium sp. OAE515]
MTDWFDDPEDVQSSWTADESWMRLYIVVGLFGIEALGMIGGMLHVLQA